MDSLTMLPVIIHIPECSFDTLINFVLCSQEYGFEENNAATMNL